MSPAGDSRRRYRNALIGATAAAAMTAAVIVAYTSGKLDTDIWPLQLGSAIALQVKPTRDVGTLPSRDSWCSVVRSAEHCWLLQESSGDAIDSGATGGWDLTPNGSPRQGVVAGIPVAGSGSVDFTGEKGVWHDAAGYLQKATAVNQDATNLATITLVGAAPYNIGTWRRHYAHRTVAAGISAGVNSTGIIWGYVLGPTTNRTIYSTVDVRGLGRFCATVVLDGRTTDAAKVYVNGSDYTGATCNAAGTGSWAASATPTIGASYGGGGISEGATFRVRVDPNVALTLAQHQEICGSFWQAPSGGSTRIVSGDATWTQTGGARCYPLSGSTAICVPGGLVPVAYDAAKSAVAVPVEPDGVNRIPYSTAIDCTNWTCRGTGTATAGKVAPDGSATASELSIGAAGNDVLKPASGYSNSVTLYPRLWVKCSAGTLRVYNPAGSGGDGHWNVACATASGGSWVLIHDATQSGVTQISGWLSSTIGGAGMWFVADSGTVTAQVWAPTLTEEPGTGVMVVPTAASAVSTGDAAWAVDNSTGRYYRTGSTVTQSLTTVSGTCWVVDGTTLRLTGATGSECSGFWHLLEVRR